MSLLQQTPIQSNQKYSTYFVLMDAPFNGVRIYDHNIERIFFFLTTSHNCVRCGMPWQGWAKQRFKRNVILKRQTQGALDSTLQIQKATTTSSGLLLVNATVVLQNRKTFLSHSPLVPPGKAGPKTLLAPFGAIIAHPSYYWSTHHHHPHFSDSAR